MGLKVSNVKLLLGKELVKKFYFIGWNFIINLKILVRWSSHVFNSHYNYVMQ
jgi:hypothetical protein